MVYLTPEKKYVVYLRGLLGVTRVTPADLSPAPDFIFLNLNWPIVKFVLEQIYFVPEQFFSCSSNKKLLENKKNYSETKSSY